jgi:FtsZ-interacting cell division protein ZipA
MLQVRAQEFVDELAKLADNPAQLTDAAMALAAQRSADRQLEDDISKMLAQDEELKASAPTFVPRKYLSPVVAEFHPTGSPEGAFGGGFSQVQAASSPSSPLPTLAPLHSSEEVYEEAEEQEAEEEDDSEAMQTEDSFFWSVAYEVE